MTLFFFASDDTMRSICVQHSCCAESMCQTGFCFVRGHDKFQCQQSDVSFVEMCAALHLCSA